MSFGEFVVNRTRGDEVVVGLLRGSFNNVTSVPFLEQCLGGAGGAESASLLAALAVLDGALLAALVAANAQLTKSARTVLLVTGCYFACWLPYMSLYLARVFGASGFAVDVAFGLAHTFANLNYLVNPFIYAWKNAEVRFAIVAVCKRLVDSKGPSRVSRLGISTIRMSHIT